MKKLKIISWAFFTVFTLSAIVATGASAEETLLAEWLFNGAPVLVLLSVETALDFEQINLVLGIEAVKLLCSLALVGSVGPNGEDEVTELLDLALGVIGQNLVGKALSCEVLTSL
jgi:hypothetical protein